MAGGHGVRPRMKGAPRAAPGEARRVARGRPGEAAAVPGLRVSAYWYWM